MFFVTLQPVLSRSALLYLAAVELFVAMESPVPGQSYISYHPLPAFLCAVSHFSISQG